MYTLFFAYDTQTERRVNNGAGHHDINEQSDTELVRIGIICENIWTPVNTK